MTGRAVLYVLLVVVGAAAAVLSFAALRDLAVTCGFSRTLAPLLPVTVDAGAAAGSLVWLGTWAPARARGFARVLALVLLASSVAANALGHGLAAYRLAPAWWVVVAVSAVAPGVLGAVVHLAVLAARPGDPAPAPIVARDLDEVVDGQDDVDDEPRPDWWAGAPPAGDEPGADRVEALLAQGVGRRRLARELGLTEHQARELLASRRNGVAS